MTVQANNSEGDEPSYRVYEIGEDGKIRTATPISAPTDEDAKAHARRMADGRVVELWDRARMILRLPPQE